MRCPRHRRLPRRHNPIYRMNPLPKDLEDRLHSINNDLATINKFARDVRHNLEGLQKIADKNSTLDLTKGIQELEQRLAVITGMIIESGIQGHLIDLRNQFGDLRDNYSTHEVIRKTRYMDYVLKAAYPPWNVIFDKVASLDGDVHVIGDEISSFIVPHLYRQEFLDFIEKLPHFQYQGPAKLPNSYMILYRGPKE